MIGKHPSSLLVLFFIFSTIQKIYIFQLVLLKLLDPECVIEEKKFSLFEKN